MAATEETKSTSKNERTKTGVVVSNKMQKTVVVAVENVVKHGMHEQVPRARRKRPQRGRPRGHRGVASALEAEALGRA